MASIFTYQEEPPRVHSPWSSPGSTTPQQLGAVTPIKNAPDGIYVTSIKKLEPERQDGPTEYKLHLLLRSRQKSPVNAAHLNSHISVPGRGSSSDSLARSLGEAAVSATPYHSSTHSRQARLQQLTTQLLWRLQQSSPFHSSSNANLVLPVLPEATPRLGVPDSPASLLPGLEESQGALYEIGVADDGTLVGLVVEELEESLSNLRAMAASLGCVVDVLRRVLVGHQTGDTNIQSTENLQLWVAEVLVRPDSGSSRSPPLEELNLSTSTLNLSDNRNRLISSIESKVEQIRVAVIGASTAGKSSLVGTLTTSVLDNGRGKSRLSLLKHRHEIASGVTSSVAQELIGYNGHSLGATQVVNYASGDVSSWPDIHNLSSRLVFLSDSPGLPRYAKSAFRTLVSWNPHWTLFCVPADAERSIDNITPISSINGALSPFVGSFDLSNVSLAHLEVCLRLDLQIVIVVTKMDIATKTDLKTTLAKVLSALKAAGRKPILLSAPSETIINPDETTDVAVQLPQMTGTELAQVQGLLDKTVDETYHHERHVPIVLTSSVTGAGFGKLHGLLKELPATMLSQPRQQEQHLGRFEKFSSFYVDETFAIPPSRVYNSGRKEDVADLGIVLCGHVASGHLAIGDQMRLGPFWLDHEVGGDSNHDFALLSSSQGDDIRRPVPQSLPGDFSKSLQGEKITIVGGPKDASYGFINVQIVSLRSLRLPVRLMNEGETGTVGIQPLDLSNPIPLSRARKGMILSSVESEHLHGYRSFAVVFSAQDFTDSNTPPLILGGHATVYTSSIRAAVKVTAVKLGGSGSLESSSPIELFDFDGENGVEGSRAETKEIQVTFKLVSSIEWLEIGRTALVVPNVAAAGPVSGPPTTAVGGLSGFVGKISDVFL